MNKLFVFLLSVSMLLCGCGHAKGGNADYTQRELPTPERIEIQTGTSVVTYGPDSEEYTKIWDALRPNWWKTAVDTPDTAPDEALFMAESPGQLKTTSDRTTRDSGDTFLCFFYEEAPLTWVNADGSETPVQMVAFLLPPVAESEENVKGIFTLSKTSEIGNNEGLFTYYYPPEIAAGFWDFLIH